MNNSARRKAALIIPFRMAVIVHTGLYTRKTAKRAVLRLMVFRVQKDTCSRCPGEHGNSPEWTHGKRNLLDCHRLSFFSPGVYLLFDAGNDNNTATTPPLDSALFRMIRTVIPGTGKKS